MDSKVNHDSSSVDNSKTLARRSIQELKQTYEVPSMGTPETPQPKSPKLVKKSKVKKMTTIFNKKISQLEGSVTISRKYNSEPENVLSPESNPASKNNLPHMLPLPIAGQSKEKASQPSPRSKAMAKIRRNPSFYVTEEALTKLTVKEKVSLYTQFVAEMSRKNANFGKNVATMEDNLRLELPRGEVVNERQESVKRLLEHLEARCASSKTTRRFCTSKLPSRRKLELDVSEKSKEFEDIVEQTSSHISSLSVTLQKGLVAKRERKAMPRRKTEGDQLFKNLDLKEPRQDAGNQPGAKTTDHCLRDQKLEDLFYSWLKNRNIQEESDKDNDNVDEGTQESTTDKLLADAVTKLEMVEIQQNQDIYDNEKENHDEKSTSDKLEAKTVADLENQQQKEISLKEKSTNIKLDLESSVKQSETEESESGISNIPKNSSDESRHENSKEDSPAEFIFAIPLKPVRKKKMRRSLSWKKDISVGESYTISTTDSDSDSKQDKALNKRIGDKPKSIDINLVADPSFVELDESLMKAVNSPRKIKSAYTLTVVSPLPNADSSLNKQRENLLENDMSAVGKIISSELPKGKQLHESRSLADSFDQGFETGSNEIDSPIRPTRKSILQRKITEIPVGSSTPIKNPGQQMPCSEGLISQQNISPIAAPLKPRRRFNYDAESRRSSLVNQVICENDELQSPHQQNKTDVFFANAPTKNMTNDNTNLNTPKSSSFWIKSGDFSISLDIHRSEEERLKLLYDIFGQRSCDAKDVYFGIDGHTFSVHSANDSEKILKRLPQSKDTSHYWFSTGDLTIPFSGKLLTTEKIQRLFQFVKASVEETGVLCFGVDQVEFSKAPEFWTQSPKYSMESNYGMLVGLQTGNSNGLEGRSHNAWPHSKSDLHQFDFESEDFEENYTTRSSLSPFGSNLNDLSSLGADELMMPRNSEAMMMSPDSFYRKYESEPLDQLFEGDANQKSHLDNNSTSSTNSVPEILNILQTQNIHLNAVKERLLCYSKTDSISCESLDALKGTPEYISRLKDIVSNISSLGCRNGFRDCSLEELERYMLFLSRYADICLNSCSGHMDKILDALMDHRAVLV